MDYMITFIEENKNIKDSLTKIEENSKIQGISIEIDPVWLELWRL